MAYPKAAITQKDANRIFKAAKNAGFNVAKIILHPDGRMEASASLNNAASDVQSDNTWDDVLK